MINKQLNITKLIIFLQKILRYFKKITENKLRGSLRKSSKFKTFKRRNAAKCTSELIDFSPCQHQLFIHQEENISLRSSFSEPSPSPPTKNII